MEQAFDIVQNLTEELGEKEDIIIRQEKEILIHRKQNDELKIRLHLYKEVLPDLNMNINERAGSSLTDPCYWSQLEVEDIEQIFSIINDYYYEYSEYIYEEFLHLKKIVDKSENVLWRGSETGFDIVNEQFIRDKYVELKEEEVSQHEDLYEIIEYLKEEHEWTIIEMYEDEDLYFISDNEM